MSKITIDNQEYDLDHFSDEARAKLNSVQFVDAELNRLSAQTAILQTARMAYSKALQAALSSVPVGDTINFN
jgi:hypothetical protein